MKNQKFGIEIEFTGMSRCEAARVVVQYLQTHERYDGGIYAFLRALELALSGQTKSKNEGEYDCKVFALTREREKLYQAINLRVDQMFESGLEREVKSLFEQYGKDVQPFKAIGYREFLPYFEGRCSKEEMIDLIKQHSRNYAKRQITFIKSMRNIRFIDAENIEKAKKQIFEEIEKWKT